MAYLRKNKNSFQLQYYLDGRKKYKQYPPGTPKAVVLAEKKRIEAQIALHKARIKKFSEQDNEWDSVTLRELTDRVIELRQSEVAEITTKKNSSAMRKFMEVVGAETSIHDLKPEHFDVYKKQRYARAVGEYERKGWIFDDDKIKRGVNKDLVNIRTVVRAAAHKDIIPESMVPKIPLYKTDLGPAGRDDEYGYGLINPRASLRGLGLAK